MVKTAVIVGLGGHARGSWVHSLKTHGDYKLIAVVDTDTEKLSSISSYNLQPLGLEDDQVYTTLQEMNKAGVKPDVAIIATPIPTHHVLVRDAMAMGINVICEKNLAQTIYQGRQMLQCAIDHPELGTAVGTQRRFTSQYWTAKSYLQGPDNQIGKLNFIEWNDCFSWGLYREGWRQFLPELFAEDQMIHWYDLMRYITGMDIVQVHADCFMPNWSDWAGSSEIIANLALAKPDDYNHRHNWTWAKFHGSWQWKGPPNSNVEFLGEKGRFKLDHRWGVQLQMYTDPAGTKWEEDGYLPVPDVENLGTKFDGQPIILEMMKNCIDSKGQKQPLNNFRDVFKSFAAVMGAIESSRTGRTIYVPDYWKDMNI